MSWPALPAATRLGHRHRGGRASAVALRPPCQRHGRLREGVEGCSPAWRAVVIVEAVEIAAVTVAEG